MFRNFLVCFLMCKIGNNTDFQGCSVEKWRYVYIILHSTTVFGKY